MEILSLSLFALAIGSFVSLITYRCFSKEPMVLARSKCINCGYKLKPKNLIPLFSWLIQGGKCSNCFTPISIRYPMIESAFLLGFVTIYFFLGEKIDLKTILFFAIFSVLMVMVIVDLEHYEIPNINQYLLTIFATILVILENGTHAVLGRVFAGFGYVGFGLLMFAFFYFFAKIEAIGIDDIKFFFIAGFMLGFENFVVFMFLSGFFGVIFGLAWQNIKKDQTFPFAPAMCLSLFLCLLFNPQLKPIELLGSYLFFNSL